MLQVKTDWRNKLGAAKSLEHLLRINVPHQSVRVSNEFKRLLASSVDRHFRRKCRRPNSRPYGPRSKKVKVAVQEFDVVAAVAADSDSESEHIHIAESDADTVLTLTVPYRAAYIDKLTLHIALQYLPLV